MIPNYEATEIFARLYRNEVKFHVKIPRDISPLKFSLDIPPISDCLISDFLLKFAFYEFIGEELLTAVVFMGSTESG